MCRASDALHGGEVDLDQVLDFFALVEPDRNAGIARQAALELAEDVRQLRLQLERIGKAGALGPRHLEEPLRAVTNELDFRNLVLGHVTLRCWRTTALSQGGNALRAASDNAASPIIAALVRAPDLHVGGSGHLWQSPPWQAARLHIWRRLHDLAVELVLPLAVLDLEDPYVGIARDLPGDVGVGLGFGYRTRSRAEATRRTDGHRACLGIDRDARLEAVELQQHRAGIGIAAPHHSGRNEGAVADAHLRAHPQSGRQAHHHRRSVYSK